MMTRTSVTLLCLFGILVALDSCSKHDVLPLPQVTTSPMTGIQSTQAISGGTIVSDGGSTILGRGICWSKNPSPTIADSYSVDGTGSGTYVSTLTALSPNTTYYVRAYAINANGTAYGAQVNFTTLAIACKFTFKGVDYSLADATCTITGTQELNSVSESGLQELTLMVGGSPAIVFWNGTNDPNGQYSNTAPVTLTVSGETWNFNGTLLNPIADTGVISGHCTCNH